MSELSKGAGRAQWFAQAVCLVTLGVSVLLLGASTASAAEAPGSLWDACRSQPPSQAPPGQRCINPRGIAADPGNGHVFVADQTNRRIIEFNALGEFIKTWGWDVVESGPGNAGTGFEICVSGNGDICKAGTNGSGIGQFALQQGVAVDSAGNIYVVDLNNFRVQKFDRQGNFVLMFGGGVNQGGGTPANPGNLCTAQHVANGDVCGAGSKSGGIGEFGGWQPGGVLTFGSFIAIDPADKVYVGDFGRIQRFDTGGVYQGEITLPDGIVVQSLATDTAGKLYYVDSGKPGVHKISPAGTTLPPGTFELPQFGFNKPVPTAVAVRVDGHVYAFGPPNAEGNVVNPLFEFDAAGNLVAEFGKGEFTGSTGLATNLCAESDPPGNLYVANTSPNNAFLRAYGTEPFGCFKARTLPPTPITETTATLRGTVNPSGLPVTSCTFEYGTTTAYGQSAPCVPAPGAIGEGNDPVPVQAAISGLAAATVHHVRLIAEVGGETETGADVEFKTLGPPVISEEHAAGVTDSEATLKALVNPEGLPAGYRFEYMTEAAFKAAGGFSGAQKTAETAIGSDRTAHPARADLKGLTPGTAYVWRVVATNTAVLDGGVSESEPHTFHTFEAPLAEPGCPNEEFRTEASTFLPDCRAYEMVSPADKNGGDIVKILIGTSDPGGYVQAAPGGEAITYTSLSAFGELEAAVNFNQYLASRTERGVSGEGWSDGGVHPPVVGQQGPKEPDLSNFNALRQFMAFTPDLCNGWLIDPQTPPPTADGQDDFRNLYRRDNCGPDEGALEALVPDPPYDLGPETPLEYVDPFSVQGHSADGSHALFVARAQIGTEAAPCCGAQVYDRFEEALHLVSVRPDGEEGDPVKGDGEGFPEPGSSEVGSGSGGNTENAVSEDGSHVYWSAGELYLRLHPEQGIVEDECDPGVACTIPVSAGSATFWTASTDGSKAIYSEGGDLFEFDLARHEAGGGGSVEIATGVVGVMGASEDLGRVYFVSRDVLAGGAADGEPNLYLLEGGETEFVATLSERDVGGFEPGATVIAYNVAARNFYLRANRVSADGSRLAFQSRAPLTGYDNTAPDGRAAVEVFAYEAATGSLECVSCNPSGGRPGVTRELLQPYVPPWAPSQLPHVPAAAWIPTWEQPLHASNVLSADGARLFFNSNDALLPRDTNGTQDVYEWEAAGTGKCDTGDADHFPQNGGCLYLISSGESSRESEFWEASRDGEDVFFTTESSLLPQDPGSIDLYDARVGGGFPQTETIAPCEGEACQSAPAPPQFSTPSSSTYSGPSNPPLAKKKRCAKGKRKVRKGGKTRCVKKKGNKKKSGKGGIKQKRRAGAERGAGR